MMNPSQENSLRFSRRSFLNQAGCGLGTIALLDLLGKEYLQAEEPKQTQRIELNGGLHHPAKAKRVIQLFMNGGVSQMDTFDYKPELEKRHGENIDFGIKSAVTSVPGALMKSPFTWKQHGECGRWVTDVFPEIAQHVDSLAFLMAMKSKTNVHGPASYMQNTGFVSPGFPCMGSWISYALGRLSDDLPSFVVLPDHRGLPYNNTGNFSTGFLPAAHAGVTIKPNSPVPIANLHPPENAAQITPASEAAGLSLLEKLNARHLQDHSGDSRLAARIESFELAAKMQLSAPEALDISHESAAMQAAYGIDDETTAPFGRNCLVARRLIQRGVRFVQVWSGMGGPANNWDNHADIPKELPYIARMVDKPIAALLTDLKQQGLLDDTLIVWTTEFGRMPFTQGAIGRDHNGGTFTTWLAGAGINPGVAYGASDDFSYQTAENETWCYDLHATILHLLGIDHQRLTVLHDGIERRLTDVHGHIIHDILA
jgi:hypothetical protein